MKRILILTPFHLPQIGGAETFVDALIKEASKENLITTLTFQPFQGKAPRYTCFNGVETIRMPWRIRHGKTWQGTSVRNFLSVFPQMFLHGLRLAKGKDIIHAQGLISGLAGVFLKKIFKTKLYVTLLALYGFDRMSPRFQGIARFIFNNCDLIFVEGENGKKDIEGTCKEHSKIRIFQHWCDQSVFRPIQIRPDDKVRVLFVGRDTALKGKHIVKEAEELLGYPEKYEFHYIDNVPYKDLHKYYQMADVFCCPSLYPEGYSRAVMEAASCGCSIITSDLGSLPEMVREFGRYTAPIGKNFKLEIGTADHKHNGFIAYAYALENFSPKNAQVFLKEYSYGNN